MQICLKAGVCVMCMIQNRPFFKMKMKTITSIFSKPLLDTSLKNYIIFTKS